MEKHIRKELDRRFVEIQAKKAGIESFESSAATKSVISLAIDAYINESKGDLIQKSTLDENFAQYATYQIRLFLFAGNDTTSSTMVYAYHLLFQHPEALEKLRKEHDAVFGTDTKRAAQILREQPAMINKCPYTLAVINETLRLYSPAATMRAGQQGTSVTDRHGNHYPMDYVGATILHPAVHSNPRVWPSPEKFLPERFLVEAGHELYPNPAAFRPFEQGRKNCIHIHWSTMRSVLR